MLGDIIDFRFRAASPSIWPVISCRVGDVPESSSTVSGLDVNGDPEVIAWPNAIDRLGEGKEGRLDGAHNWPSSSPPTS
jgi:hypothetical protein